MLLSDHCFNIPEHVVLVIFKSSPAWAKRVHAAMAALAVGLSQWMHTPTELGKGHLEERMIKANSVLTLLVPVMLLVQIFLLMFKKKY